MLTGCDDLREWLWTHGFTTGRFSSRDNECNWYAYRPSSIAARECECNDGKPMQLVVRPFMSAYQMTMHTRWASVEVDVTGEAGGMWFKLTAYSLKPDDLRERLGEIESSLIAAWNALFPVAPVEAS